MERKSHLGVVILVIVLMICCLCGGYFLITTNNEKIKLYAQWKEINSIPVYRMYNPRTGEHLYTTDALTK